MLIEQIIELQLRRPGPPGLTCTPTNDYFHDKTKISKAAFTRATFSCENRHLASFLSQIA